VVLACKSTPAESDAGCRSDQLKVYAPGLCGKGKKPGVCAPKPVSCAGPYAPVCGCDGQVYDSECAAHASGIDVSTTGGCKRAIPGWVACGGHFCDVGTSYCEMFLSDVLDPPSDYFCRPLPASCLPRDGAVPGCECFPPGTRCGTFCGPLPTAPGAPSGFHLTCQGRRPPTE
jgi:hypothetical protein